MTELNTDAGATGSEEPSIVREVPTDTPAKLSTTEAARLLASLRKPKQQETQTTTANEKFGAHTTMTVADAADTQSPAQTEDASPPPEVPGETQATDPEVQAEQPSIEPPRSWTKEAKERWASLPRETQEYLAEREQQRDREVLRSQNEATEKLKGLTAKEQAAEQARQQYENALPQLLTTLQQQQAGQFADIKSLADVQRLAAEDPLRYNQWQVHNMSIAAVEQEMKQAQTRQVQERQDKLTEFAKTQDNLLHEKVPDMADKDKADKLQKDALKVLKDVGFNDDELARAWNMQSDFPLRDHRVQMLIIDAVRWRDAQAKAKAIVAKPVPPVQRPGVPQGKGAMREAEITNLGNKLDKATGINAIRAAADLVKARRASAR